ncbi:MAG: MFS transporter [Nevskiaceae bacterium]|jgi:AAHS family 4-hydroxybenzoate transporter-like MFS transporter|nr:MFS transporter [Nevskiaceae bacterium]
MQRTGIEIDDLIASRPLSSLQLGVIVLCALAVMFDGFDMQTMALTVPALSATWGVPAVTFSTALAISSLGMGLGAAFIAPLGDRLGRRTVLCATLLVLAAGSAASALSHSPTELVVWRFITGLGLGGSMPNAFALTADYLPRARRTTLLTVMYCNTATGALIAGLSSPWLIGHFGWQGPFIAGSALPLIACVLLLIAAPESLKFLLLRRPLHASIPALVKRIAPDVNADEVYLQAPPTTVAGTIGDLLQPVYRRRTLWLWLGFMMNAFILFLVVSWLPTLLVSAGWTQTRALQASALNQVGGILGGLSLAWLMTRLGSERVLSAGFLLCMGVLLAFLVAPSGFWTWGALLLLVGACIGGAQFAIPTLLPAYYPPAILSTGGGWASAAARAGAFVSPLIGGQLLAQGMQSTQVLALLTLPAAIAAVSMLVLSRMRSSVAAG